MADADADAEEIIDANASYMITNARPLRNNDNDAGSSEGGSHSTSGRPPLDPGTSAELKHYVGDIVKAPMLRTYSEASGMSDFEIETPTMSPLKSPLRGPRDLPLYRRRRRQLWKVARSPWYISKGTRAEPLVIGVTGGTASGKTTVCRKIIEKLGIPWVVMISMDRFYRELTPEEHVKANNREFNWDHPDAFDWKLFQRTIKDIRTGQSVEVPRYDFATNSRMKKTDTVYGADIVIIEGILVLHDKPLRDLMDIKVFVDADSDLRLARRIKRDIVERGRAVEDILEQYVKTVKPSFDDYIFPTKRYADLIVPRGGDNYVAINLLVQHVKATLKKRGLIENHSFRLRMSSMDMALNDKSSKDKLLQLLPPTVHILEQTPMLRALHTELRDGNTKGLLFRNCVHRVGRLIVNKVLGMVCTDQEDAAACSRHQPSKRFAEKGSARKKNIAMNGRRLFGPIDDIPDGDDEDLEDGDDEKDDFEMQLDAPVSVEPRVFGVSIVRGGQAIEAVLKEFLPEVKIGKIIIAQGRDKSYGPRLYYCRFPRDVKTAPVVLMDPILATSNTCEMALRILLEHGIREDQIILACIIAAPQGLLFINKHFPKVRIVASWVDQGLDSQLFVTPGAGYFGARYFNCGDISSGTTSIFA